MFNSVTALGGAGISDPHTGNIATACVYIFFTLSAFFAGSVVNTFGVKPCLFVGATTYCFYISTLCVWASGSELKWLVILGGSVVGLGAGLLHASKGVIIMAYPDRANKGKFISIFWGIFNAGGVFGGALVMATNW